MISAASRFFSRSGRGVAGTAGIEFAAVAVIFSGILIPAADLGLGIYRKMQVQNSAQAGAQYARLKGFSATAVTNAVTATTGYTGVAATPAPAQFCGCPTTAGLSTVTCGSNCAGGMAAGTYATVSAQSTYTPLFHYPGFPAQYVLTAKSTVRLQ